MEQSISDLIVTGLELMLIGMGIVYLFLALLVWVIGMTARLIQRLSPEPPPHVAFHAPVAGSAEAIDDPELVAAISAAIHDFQNR